MTASDPVADEGRAIFETYFHDWEVRPDFAKEFVCIFDGWLGTANLHKLDEVTDDEFSRLNHVVRLMHRQFRLCVVDMEARSCSPVDDVEPLLVGHEASGAKSSDEFTKLVIPELGAVYTEEWDYTWILWHKNDGAVGAVSPLIRQAGLYHWHD